MKRGFQFVWDKGKRVTKVLAFVTAVVLFLSNTALPVWVSDHADSRVVIAAENDREGGDHTPDMDGGAAEDEDTKSGSAEDDPIGQSESSGDGSAEDNTAEAEDGSDGEDAAGQDSGAESETAADNGTVNTSDGGNADGGNADGGNADGGNADGGNADGGNADGGNADCGNADGGASGTNAADIAAESMANDVPAGEPGTGSAGTEESSSGEKKDAVKTDAENAAADETLNGDPSADTAEGDDRKENRGSDTEADGSRKDPEKDDASTGKTGDDAESPAFEASKTVGGVKVTVAADGGVFPEGATLSVRKISGSEEKSVSAAVEDAKGNGGDTKENGGDTKEQGGDAKENGGNTKKTAVSYTFDIKVLDKDGNEIEPDETKGSVSVSFALGEAENQNLAAEVWHITGESGELDAEALDAKTDGETVTAETDGFSYYQVEFTYDGKQYVLPGDESVALTEILGFVGITNADGSTAKDADITAAKGSDDELFTVEKKDGVWTVTAVRAFHTEEWLRVTVDGVEYEIVVTDAEWEGTGVLPSNIKVGDILAPGTGIAGTIFVSFNGSPTTYGFGDGLTGSFSVRSDGVVVFKNKNVSSTTFYPEDEAGNKVSKWIVLEVGNSAIGYYMKIRGYSTPKDASYSSNTSFTYDGSSKTAVTGSNVSITGTNTATNAGSYTATVTPQSGHAWNDGTTDAKTVSWTISPQSLTIPTLSNTTKTYTGSSQSPTVSGYDSTTMTQSGDASATNVGSYTVKWKLKNTTNYKWSDNTTGEKSGTWSIAKAGNPLSLTGTQSVTKTFSTSAQTATLASATNGQGTVSYSIASQKLGTTAVSYFSLNGTTLSIKGNTPAGTYTVVVRATAAGNSNYNSGTKDSTITVAVGKATPTVTAPTAKTLTYTGSEQALINAGSTTGGTIQYKLGSGSYKTTIPAATAAGNYTVYYKVVGDTNYNDVAEKSISVTVGTASMNVSANGYSADYDGAEHGITVNAPSGATVKYGTTSGNYPQNSSPTYKNAGTYTVYYEVTRTNYTPVTGSAKVTITKKAVKVSGITAQNKTYNGNTIAELNTGGASFEGIVSGDTLTVSATGTFADANAGMGKTIAISGLTLGGADADNYKLAATGNQSFTTADIRKRSITLTSATAEKTYDGDALTNSTVTVEGGGFVSGEGASYTVTGSQTVVGSSENSFTYTLNSGTLAQNYDITCISGTLAVTKANNTFTSEPSIAGWVYGDTPAVPNKGTTKFGDRQDITVQYKGKGGTVYEKSGTPPTAAGSYSAIFEQAETANYESISCEKDFTITPKEVGLSWSNLEFTYDGDSHKPTATATNLVGDDTCTVTVTGEQTNAGSYTATAGSLSNNNYKLPSANTTEFTINPCATAIDISVSDMIYTGEALQPVPTVRAAANNDKIIGASEYTVAYEDNSEAGTARVTVSDKDGGNYIITGNSKTFTVIQKSIANDNTEEADNKEGLASVLVGEFPDVTYSGAAHTPEAGITYNGSALQPGEDYTISYEGNVAKGTATVTIAGKGCYKGTVEKTFTIVKRPVTVSGIRAQDKIYDGNASAEIDVSEAVLDGRIDGDDLTVTTEGGTFDSGDAGDNKTVTINGLSLAGADSGNYVLTGESQQTAAASIRPKDIAPARITLAAAQAQYNGEEQTVEVTGVTLQGTALTASVDYDILSGNKGTDCGAYTLVIKGKGNYTGEASVQWEITEKPMTVTASGETVTYDGNGHTIAVTVAEPADGVTIRYGDAEGIYNATEPPVFTDAGVYTVYYRVTADNYEPFTGSAAVTISKATLTVSADEGTKVYGGEDPVFSYSVAGLQGEDTAGDVLTGALSRMPGENVGTYEILQGDLACSRNYEISFVKGSLSITKAGHADMRVDDPVVVKPSEGLAGAALELASYLEDGAALAGSKASGELTVKANGISGKTLHYAAKASDGQKGTLVLTVESRNYEAYALTISFVAKAKTAEIRIADNAVETAVTGVSCDALAAFAEEQSEPIVTVRLAVTPQSEETLSASLGAEAVKGLRESAAKAFSGVASGLIANDYLDVTITKEADGSTGEISDVGKPFEIEVAFDLTDKYNPVVIREHEGSVAQFTRLDSRPAAGDYRDGTFYTNGTDTIWIYSRYFSTYTIAYTSAVSYQVTFDGDNGNVTQTIVQAGAAAVRPADPVKDGYAFAGWYSGGSEYSFDTPVNADMTITAHWKSEEKRGNTAAYSNSSGSSSGSRDIQQIISRGAVIVPVTGIGPVTGIAPTDETRTGSNASSAKSAAKSPKTGDAGWEPKTGGRHTWEP